MSGPVILVVAKDELVNELVARFKKDTPAVLVIRAYPFAQEVKNLLYGDGAEEPLLFPKNGDSPPSIPDTIMEWIINNQQHCHDAQDPSCDPISLSEIAKTRFASDDRWSLITAAREEQVNDPSSFEKNTPNHRKIVVELLIDTLMSAGAVACTPETLNELVDQIPTNKEWKPPIIITDDAELMTRAQLLMLPSRFPTTKPVFFGDTSGSGSNSAFATMIQAKGGADATLTHESEST